MRVTEGGEEASPGVDVDQNGGWEAVRLDKGRMFARLGADRVNGQPLGRLQARADTTDSVYPWSLSVQPTIGCRLI
jgi:hypothetical protein